MAFDFDGLMAGYSAALDERRYADWLEFFAEVTHYKLQPRENFDRGLPLCTMDLESLGMLKDRVYSIENTLFHAPYYQRHILSPARILEPTKAHINYAVFRTRSNERSEVFNVGRYLLEVELTSGKIKSLSAIFDSEMIPNSIIYPI